MDVIGPMTAGTHISTEREGTETEEAGTCSDCLKTVGVLPSLGNLLFALLPSPVTHLVSTPTTHLHYCIIVNDYL